MLLRHAGFDVVTASSPAGALSIAKGQELDAALVDLNYARDTTSGREGLDLLSELQEVDPTLPVVVMTAWGSVEGAVDAMRRGARDYVTKPWDNARLVATVRTQVELGRALRGQRPLTDEKARPQRQGPPQPLGDAQAMQPGLGGLRR